MADLVVKCKCKSVVRDSFDIALNTTFPLWGIVCPIASIGVLFALVSKLQTGDLKDIGSMAVFALVTLCYSLCSILLKRALARDVLVIDKQGFKLPRFLGNSFNLRTYLPWPELVRVAAQVDSQELMRSRLSIVKKTGHTFSLRAENLGPELTEQFVLATRMWAPAICDESLDELQNVLRIGVQNSDDKSYTALWEEELERRFCPTSYIPLETGKTLRNNSLKVIRHLASGGLSALYLCQLDGVKLVVLKEATIPETGAENIKDKAKELFEREAHLLMKIDNPGIVHVLDCFSEGARNYMLLEYVNGQDLRQMIRQNGAQAEAEVLEWAIQIANTLKYLHEREQPILHRDLTPDNIVLRNDGHIVVVDFGAANEYIGNATGTFVGKHAYIAPEQLRGKASIHSDIYAFGCTLFYLLTGHDPEALSTSDPREHAPAVSSELAELIDQCTQMEARDRYQSVAQLLPVLKRLAAQSTVV